ncbi:PAS domain S-box protein [Planctomycetota bacterium]
MATKKISSGGGKKKPKLVKNKSAVKKTSVKPKTAESLPVTGLLAVEQDITERKQAGEALKKRVKELDGLFNLRMITDRTNNLEEIFTELVNEVAPASMQFPDKTIVKITFDDEVYSNCPIEEASCSCQFNDIIKTDVLFSVIEVNGKQRGMLEVGYTEDLPFIEKYEQRLLDGYAERLEKTIIHIEDNVEIQKAKKFSDNIISSIYDGLFVLDDSLNIIFVNQQGADLLGLLKDDLIGIPLLGCPGVENAAHILANSQLSDILKKGIIKERELYFKSRSGKNIPVSFSGAVMRDETGAFTGIVCLVKDITERKEAEEALKESEKNYRTLFDGFPDGVIIADESNGQYLHVNPSACEKLGYTEEEIKSLSMAKIHPQEDMERIAALFYAQAKGEIDIAEDIPFYHKDGTLRYFDINSVHVEFDGVRRIVGLLRDITERKEMEAQLLQAQKMEAVGSLASGLAHDFNNIIGMILGNAELYKHKIQKDKTSPGELVECFDRIITATDRAKNLTRQMLGFARKGKYNPQDMDVNIVVRELAKLLKKGFVSSRHYRIKNKLKARSLIHADGNQLHQVIQNLAINARDAMPAGGTITISTEDIKLDEKLTGKYATIPEGQYIKLSVADTGSGIKDDNLGKIFDPFFTTKDRSSGTGLGLSTVWGIVKNHDGYVDINTQTDMGTAFAVYFPAVQPKAKRPEDTTAISNKEKGKILFVEDEPELLEISKLFIEMLGYDVVAVQNGKDALNMYADGGFDIVLTDLIMQPMDGVELFEEIIKLDPNAVVYITSGLSDDERIQDVLNKGCKGFLEKPIKSSELAKAMQAAMSLKQRHRKK